MFRRALPAVLAAAAALIFVPAAQGKATQCKGGFGGELTGVVAGDVLVPDGAACWLDNARVEGTVNVEDDAVLVTSDSRIRGSLVCHRCERMSVNFMYGVDGNVRIRGMNSGAVYFDGVPIGGRFQARNNAAEFSIIDTFAAGRFSFSNNAGAAGFWFSGSRADTAKFVGNQGDFQLFAVRGARNLIFSHNVGFSDISESSAGRRLQCFDNDPAPVGLLNSAGIAIEGQCTTLVGDGD
jgi:hypothetical protein